MSSKRLGLFIGAGFSYEAGMPLVWDLTAEIKNWLTPEKFRELNKNWEYQGGGYPEHVIENFESVLRNPSLHYESILGHIEVQMQRFGTDRQAYHRLYSWLVNLVYQLLYYRQVNNDQLFDRHLDFYAGIKTLTSNDMPLWVFSLNHDLMIEAIARKYAIPLHTGFSKRLVRLPRRNIKGKKIGEILAETLTKQELEEQAMYFPNPGVPGIYLLKLHGALDVFAFNEGNDILKLIPDGEGMESIFSTLKAVNEELLYPHPGSPTGKVHVSNEIAYADDDGEIQFLRRSLLAGAYKFDPHKSQVMPKSMLKHFKAQLNFVTKLVCIGYGFGDTHINQILREWLSFSNNRYLEIVDPMITNIPSFLLHLAPQVSLLKCSTTAYFDSAAGIQRSYKEQLFKKVSDKAKEVGPKAKELMANFSTSYIESAKSAYLEKLQNFLKTNGKLDSDTIENIQIFASILAQETYGTEEELLENILKILSAAENT